MLNQRDENYRGKGKTEREREKPDRWLHVGKTHQTGDGFRRKLRSKPKTQNTFKLCNLTQLNQSKASYSISLLLSLSLSLHMYIYIYMYILLKNPLLFQVCAYFFIKTTNLLYPFHVSFVPFLMLMWVFFFM